MSASEDLQKFAAGKTGDIDPQQTWAKRLIAAQRLREGALGQITVSDEAGECGNRLIGTACSRHLRNSRTNRMHMVPPKWG